MVDVEDILARRMVAVLVAIAPSDWRSERLAAVCNKASTLCWRMYDAEMSLQP